ncbi:hypothetical protein PQU92_02665 [Asticcacaulis sp. BYS171W]|uniref:Uncharacterized protein n=1 Tax=Asticcacaulis aquaticus TaxID=2984212 RepID=A0ABT5HQQ2_9CAUL|nr:hypothetical protein [Asticcacaulis aquaticus]MDC7682160.1 hypothetical protein [Asticcacaulis aquaticus]
MERAGIDGFVYQGPVRVSPIGTHALYEGQARFIQLQFLSFALEDAPNLAGWRQKGMLDGEYGEAFDAFLEITGAVPSEIDDPAVALFMLILDIAINPSRGFPIQIESFENFLIDVDAGIRFVRLCQAARDEKQVLSLITEYSFTQYAEAADILTSSCGYDHPLAVIEHIVEWQEHSPVAKLMEEKRGFTYDLSNIVVRVMSSHFLAFCDDKLSRPEFFCWPGAWMTGARASQDITNLFLKHLSLFTDKADDDGIFPRAIPGVSEENAVKTLTAFYANVINYDLVRQWILSDGPFNYEFGWLTSKHSKEDMTNSTKQAFQHAFGASPDSFTYTWAEVK